MMEMQVDSDGCVMRATEARGEWTVNFLGYVVPWPGGSWFAVSRYGECLEIKPDKALVGSQRRARVWSEGMRVLHDKDVELRITYPDPSDRMGICMDISLEKRKDCVYAGKVAERRKADREFLRQCIAGYAEMKRS